MRAEQRWVRIYKMERKKPISEPIPVMLAKITVLILTGL
jgi:hypothetical protein